MHTFSVFFFFFLQFEFMFLFCFVLFFFSLIFQADTSSYLFHLVVENLILHIFLIIMIIMPCSGMFRNVPECSMFRLLSTPWLCKVFFCVKQHNFKLVTSLRIPKIKMAKTELILHLLVILENKRDNRMNLIPSSHLGKQN